MKFSQNEKRYTSTRIFSMDKFFYKVKKANSLIFLDNVQYNRRSYQNRNYIKTNNGKKFLTVPLKKSSESL